MIVFDVLVAIKQFLEKEIEGVQFLLSREVEAKGEFCVIELMDSVSSFIHSSSSSYRIQFRVMNFQRDIGVKKIMDKAHLINKFLEGSIIDLKGKGTVVIRNIENRIDFHQQDRNKTVTHIYDALIRINDEVDHG